MVAWKNWEGVKKNRQTNQNAEIGHIELNKRINLKTSIKCTQQTNQNHLYICVLWFMFACVYHIRYLISYIENNRELILNIYVNST